MRRSRFPAIVVVVAGVIAFLWFVTSMNHSADEAPAAAPVTASEPSTPPAAAANTDTPSPRPTPGARTAQAQLATLPVKGKSPLTGYARTADFGRAWLDVNHNGCDTRNDILERDLTHILRSGRCKILSGVLAEPYTGRIIDFVRGIKTSALVQIDHLVPLANAWQTGAQKLSQNQRIALANDPLELLAVDGSSNEQKGDGDAATWLPAQKSFRCTYVARQIAVKARYHLWVTPAERDAMLRILGKCPGEAAAS